MNRAPNPGRRWVCAGVAAALVAFGGACRPRHRAVGTPAPGAAPENSQEAGGTDVPSGAEVRGLVARWLEAQNHNDFDGYQSLYAARFAGVKRAGVRTRTFDRDGWMADRREMFRAALRVEAMGVEVQAGAGTAVVSFTQRFSSGAFHDEGPKRMVIVREGASLRIAREEMVRSELGGADAAPPAIAPGSFMLTVDHHGAYVVLHTAPEPGWSEGAAMLIEREGVVVTRKNARASALPPELAALRGRSVRLYGPAGALCTGTLRALVVMHRVSVHFGTEQRWAGEGGGPAYSAEHIAREAWGLGDDGSFLAGEIEASEGTCTGARWARASDLAAPTVYAPTPAAGALAASATARYRALPGWASVQSRYRESPPDGGASLWDEFGHTRPTVTVWQSSAGGRRYVTVRSRVVAGGCGDFTGEFSAVFEAVGTELVLQTDGGDPGSFEPLAATDADGDGAVDFITPEGLFRRRGSVLRAVESVRWPNLGCDC